MYTDKFLQKEEYENFFDKSPSLQREPPWKQKSEGELVVRIRSYNKSERVHSGIEQIYARQETEV